MKTALPALGVSDFKEIIKSSTIDESSSLYFDKTLMIKDLVEDRAKFFLFTRPRRFGKSLNMSMLKYFFGTNEDLFSGLQISQYPDIIEKYRGKFPTIFLSLKCVEGNNYEDMLDGMSFELNNLLSTIQQNYLDADLIRNFRFAEKNLTYTEIKTSIFEFSKILYNHYGNPVLILIDEYDTPLNTAYAKGYLDQAIDLIRSFFSQTFKDNPYLFKGILTGINRIAKESIFSELNNFKTHDIDSEEYSTYYGFTEDEIASLDMPEKNKTEIKEWYNGYNFGGTIIYNPWSVLNYISTAPKYRTKSYWSNSGGTALIDANISISKAEDLQTLLDGGKLLIEIDSGLVFTRLKTERDAFYNLLYSAGYLTAIGDWEDNFSKRNLRVVNKEVLVYLQKIVLDWFSNKSGSNFTEKLVLKFVEGDYKYLEYALNETALSTFSYYDVANNNQESFYHGFLLGISLGTKERYVIKSNRESGYGRYDIAWYPKDVEKDPGILIELKIDNSSAEEALAQIDTKKYEAELVRYGCKKIISYGIHADGKKIKVAMKK
jgi:hypothetical protein